MHFSDMLSDFIVNYLIKIVEMANTHMKLDSCLVCKKLLNNNVIKCELCEAVFHKLTNFCTL